MLNVVKGPAFVVYFSRCFAVLIIENKKKKGFVLDLSVRNDFHTESP